MPSDAILDPAKFPADAVYCVRGIEEVKLPAGSFYYTATFRFAEIANRTNLLQVRSETTPAHVVEMIASHKKGIGFPPVLMRRTGPNAYITLDGIHRVEMYAETGTETFPAVVVDAPDAVAAGLAALMNGYNGMPNTDDDRLAVGMFMHTMPNGLGLESAARYARVTKTRLADYIKRTEGSDRAGMSGIIVQWNSLDATSQATLGSLKNREAFKEAVILVSQAKLGTDEVKGIVRDLVKIADVDLQKEHIAKCRQEWESTITPKTDDRVDAQSAKGNQAQARAHKAFGTVHRMLTTTAFDGIFTSQEERQVAQEALVGLREDINKALAKLRKL